MKDHEDGGWLSPAQLAEVLGVSTRTVWRWVESGTLPQPVRISRKTLRWSRKAVDVWLKDPTAHRTKR